MGDGYHRVRTLPRAASGEIRRAIFGDNVIRLTARRCDNIAAEARQHARMENSGLVAEGAAHAQKCLAAAGQRRSGHKIELAAGAAYLARSRTLGCYLPVEVGIQAAVYRDHAVVFRDDIRVVDVAERHGHEAGVVVYPVVQLFAADSEPVHTLAGVQRLAAVRELTGAEHREIPVGAQLRVHAEIVQVGLRNEPAERVRHTADAELHCRPVVNVREDVAGDHRVRLRRLRGLHVPQRKPARLNDVRHLGYVDALALA